MPPQELLDYIKTQLDKGVHETAVKNKLLAIGWDGTVVDQALSLYRPHSSAAQQQNQSLNLSSSLNSSSGTGLKIAMIKTFIYLLSLFFIGIGIFVFFQHKKAATLPATFAEEIDTKMNPIYATVIGINTQEKSFENMRFKYHLDWELKEQSLNGYPWIGLTKKAKDASAPTAGIIVRKRSKQMQSDIGTCEEYFKKKAEVYALVPGAKIEVGKFTANNFSGDVLYTGISTPFGPARRLNFCFSKNDDYYEVELAEQGLDKNFLHLDEATFILNSMEFL